MQRYQDQKLMLRQRLKQVSEKYHLLRHQYANDINDAKKSRDHFQSLSFIRFCSQKRFYDQYSSQ
jgi:hypothetical protein